MKENMHAFSIEIPSDEKGMQEFQEMMDRIADQTVLYIQNLAKELDCSEACASDVYYLRSRSRWTQNLEDKLIQLHKEGNPPNVFDWPE